MTARGTSYDWMTYFWDMVAQQGTTIPEIWDLWDHANPGNWNIEAGNPQPHDAMHTAATGLVPTYPDILDQHEAAMVHGLDTSVH